jgi:hypothetical protein
VGDMEHSMTSDNDSVEELGVIFDMAGVRAGKAAGCAVVAVTGTTSRAFLDQADLVVGSLRELTPEIFKDLIRFHRKVGR